MEILSLPNSLFRKLKKYFKNFFKEKLSPGKYDSALVSIPLSVSLYNPPKINLLDNGNSLSYKDKKYSVSLFSISFKALFDSEYKGILKFNDSLEDKTLFEVIKMHRERKFNFKYNSETSENL